MVRPNGIRINCNVTETQVKEILYIFLRFDRDFLIGEVTIESCEEFGTFHRIKALVHLPDTAQIINCSFVKFRVIVTELE